MSTELYRNSQQLVSSLQKSLQQRQQMARQQSNYLNKAYLPQVQQVQQTQQNAVVKDRNVGSTIADVVGSPITGLEKFGEGVVDFFAGLVGTVGGWFNDDFKDDVDEFIKRDLVGDTRKSLWGTNWWEDAQRQSYLSDSYVGRTVRDALVGVGQSLPSLGLGFLPSGQIISLTALGASAMGGGTDEALNSGATHGQAMAYGALSGGMEMFTERLFGGTDLTKRAYGSGMLDKLVGTTGKGRFIKGMIEEGIEEGVSTFANPVLQKMTYNPNAEWMTKEHLKQIGQDALVGGLSAGITQGAANMTRVGRVSNNLQILQETQQAKQALFNKNNLTAESTTKIVADENRAKANISKALQAMDEQRRNKYLEKHGLNRYFNADGSIKAPNNENYNKNTYSPILEGREDELVFKPLNKDVELTSDQQYAKETFNKLNRNDKVGIVFTDDARLGENGAYHNGVAYINTNSNTLKQVITMHELNHSIEGSKDYSKFSRFVIDHIENSENLRKEFGSYFEKYDYVAGLYENNPKTQKSNLIEQLIENKSETMAKYISENLFTNEESINRLAKSEGNLFKKIYNWIKLKIENYQKRKTLTKEQREVFDFLRNAEKLYKKALDAQGQNRELERALKKQENQKVDKNEETQYNLNGEENGNGREEKEWNSSSSDNDTKWTSRNDTRDVSSLSKEQRELNLYKNERAIELFKVYLDARNAYKVVSSKEIFGNFGKENESVKIIKSDYLPNQLKSLVKENIQFGYNTEFFVLDGTSLTVAGFTKDENGTGKIYLAFDERLSNFINTNRHEKLHNIKVDKPYLYESFVSNLNGILSDNEKNTLYNKYFNKYKDAYGQYNIDTFKSLIWSEIYAQIYAKNETISNQSAVDKLIKEFEDKLKKEYNFKDDIKFSLAEKDENQGSKITTNWGDGYTLNNNNYEDYNLIAFKDDVGLNAFNALLSEVENLVAGDYENKSNNYSLRMKLFNNLQQQKNRVYSKLLEINQALDKTKKSYDNNEKINIKKTFIKNLGYNGLYVDPKSATKYKSVVFDVNHKKENLLDYSKERAKDRLEKAIQLFGETKNPKKAGWLLSDGRFVDYNRDSANILSDRDDIELDYQDHYQIEKVFSSRRGTDAIDAFMAEGNIRLMPEGGGIEIRNRPTYKQVSKLEEFINSVIDEKGVVLDLREPNTTENVMPNFVYYDSTTDARTIINDINSFYNNGSIPRTIDGVKYSLADIDKVDNKSNASYNYNEYQYDKFGWVRANNILNSLEWKDFNKKFVAARNGTKVNRAASGALIIPVNGLTSERFGINNVLVYAKGTISNPQIEKIIKINLDNETDIDIIRRDIYAAEKKSWTRTSTIIRYYYPEELVREYSNKDCPNYQEYLSRERERSSRRESEKDTRVNRAAEYGSRNTGSNKEDIKYSLDDSSKQEPLEKAYSKADAEKIIKDIVDNDLTIDNNYGMLKGKMRKKAVEKLFKAMNDRKVVDRPKLANKIADFIINNAVYENMLDNDALENAMNTKEAIKQYRNGVKLDGIKDEIKYHFDNQANSIYLQWSNKNGVNPDELGSLLREQGIEINGSTASDIFFDMLDKYQTANEQIKKAAQKVKADNFNENELAKLRKNIANNVMQSFATYGTETHNSIVISNLMWKVDDLKEQLNYSKNMNKVINRILDNAQNLKDLKNKKYHNAGDTFFEELKAPEGLLSGIKNRSDISKSTTRKRVIEYGKFYNEQNELLRDYIDKDILDDIALIANNENQNAALSFDEIKALDRILLNFKHIANSYDTIFRNGRTEKVLDLAQNGYAIIEKTPQINTTLFTKGMLSIINPRVVLEQLDNFDPNGVITTLMNDVKNGETNMLNYKMELEAPFKAFLDKHKKYIKELDKTKMTIRGVEISKNQALSLLLLSERRQAKAHIENGGVSVWTTQGKFLAKHEVKETIRPTEVDFKKISDSLTDVDREYLNIVRKFFNEDARQLKIDTDIKLKGYTNVEDSNDYYPISVDRDVVAHNLGDARSFTSEIQNTYSYSFNKEVKQNAANRIIIGDVTSTVQKHIDNMSNYAGLAEPIRNFDLVYNRNLAERDANGNIIKGTEKSIREITSTKWVGAREYIATYLNDILGVNYKKQTWLSKLLEKIRSGFAKFQLGFNVKVWFNQLTSIPAAATVLDWGCIGKGLAIKTNYAEMDKYCVYAKARNYDNAVVKSESQTDKVGKIGEISTKPISKFDRGAIGKLWNACQYQVEKYNNLAFGTEENKVEAGKLLEKVIRETQPNFNASERASILRSDHEIVKAMTMFMSQPMQNLSLLVEGVLQYKTLKQMQKNGVQGLETRLQESKMKIKKAVAGVGAETILFVLVAQVFKRLFGKDDKEEPVLDVAKDFGGALSGMFPLVRDVYNKLVYKYDADIFVLDSFNTLGDAVNSMNSLLEKMVSGEDITSNQVMSVFKKMCMGLGMVTGIPTRNVLNQLLGIIRNIDPELAEEIQHSYNANYGKKKTTSTTAKNNLQNTLNKALKSTNKTTTKKSKNTLQESLNNLLRSK